MIKYGKTKEYQKNRVEKIMRNKLRRKEYKGRYINTINNKQITKKKVNCPPLLILLSGGIKSFKRTTLEVPKVFSFTSNPEETIGFISNVSSCFRTDDDELTININFANCIQIDIGALSVLDVVFDSGAKYFNLTKRNISINAIYPENEKTALIFNYSGLPQVFNKNMHHPRFVILNPNSSDKDPLVEANRIIEYYNSCLKKCGYVLNETGISYFGTLIGELVDNSIIHCGSYGPLNFSGGFYDANEFRGQLSIISLGNTLYSTLNSLTTSSELLSDIRKIVNAHKKGIFREETIWTICALQEGVSCRKTNEDSDRGTGTVKMIEAFLEVGQTATGDKKPIMSIVSGKTHILFDGKYKLTENNSGNKKIAFNERNDLNEDPDPNYVKEMNYEFPGVIINVEFYIDKDHLKKYERKD